MLDPVDLIDGIDLELLVAKRTTGLMPETEPKCARRRREGVPRRHPRLHGADALRFTMASSPADGPQHQLRPQALRGLPQLLQQAVERHALRADELRRPGLRPEGAHEGGMRPAAGAATCASARPTAGSPASCSASKQPCTRALPSTAWTTSPTRSTLRLGRVLRLVPGIAKVQLQSGSESRSAPRAARCCRVLERCCACCTRWRPSSPPSCGRRWRWPPASGRQRRHHRHRNLPAGAAGAWTRLPMPGWRSSRPWWAPAATCAARWA